MQPKTESKRLRVFIKSEALEDAKGLIGPVVFVSSTFFHVRLDEQKRNCVCCDRQVFVPACVRSEQNVMTTTCPGSELYASAVKELRTRAAFNQCARILANEPSQVPVPQWSEILAHPDVAGEQPFMRAAVDKPPIKLVHLCAIALRADVLRLVLKQWPESANLACYYSAGTTPLTAALMEREQSGRLPEMLACVQALLVAKADVNAQDGMQSAALSYACMLPESEHACEIVRTLLAAKAGVNQRGYSGQLFHPRSFLLMFVRCTHRLHSSAQRRCRQQRGHPHSAGRWCSPASQSAQRDAVSLGDHRRQGRSRPRTRVASHQSAVCGRPGCVEREGGQVPEHGPHDGRETPLVLAASLGDLATAKTLVECKANVNASPLAGSGLTAFHYALRNQHLDVAKLLLAAGCCRHPLRTQDAVKMPDSLRAWLRSVQTAAVARCDVCGLDNSADASEMTAAVDKMEERHERAKHDTCANPACKFAKAQSLPPRLMKCARCQRAKYCSRECQAQHWRTGHKQACKLAAQ